jgi:Family of unknown function (DUF6232)
MSTLAAAVQQLADRAGSEKQEYDHGSLKIRANTLVIGNSIFPIANISRIDFSDLRNPVPLHVWIMLGAGVLGLFMGDTMAAMGVLLLLIAGFLLYRNWMARSAADYALTVEMNSGYTPVILGNNGDFLKSIALELHDVIEYERPSNTTFHIDQSLRVDNITGSRVSVTGIQGDIVNNVPGV